MNTGFVRIAIIAVLVVTGIVVLTSGFSGSTPTGAAPGGGGVVTPTIGGTPPPTHTPKPTETPSPQVSGVNVMVFNGTAVVGLGADVQAKMFKDGYKFPVAADNAPHEPVAASVVYFRGGGADEAQNRADAQYVADTYMNKAKVKQLSSEFDALVDPSVTVVVIVGVDYSAQ